MNSPKRASSHRYTCSGWAFRSGFGWAFSVPHRAAPVNTIPNPTRPTIAILDILFLDFLVWSVELLAGRRQRFTALLAAAFIGSTRGRTRAVLRLEPLCFTATLCSRRSIRQVCGRQEPKMDAEPRATSRVGLETVTKASDKSSYFWSLTSATPRSTAAAIRCSMSEHQRLAGRPYTSKAPAW